ncbi:16S rRNA (cytosine967-C5)-methyltransferase [Tenacibaculum sp. MAR_2009_124]|uniref:RsmB/NOP family class I SAM-dependent RNA methyltransferase n=1 Tax=Tenacibaculum sp. MAR_2009_124 TaxID=1250059 RepID=UPI00089490BF|nr:RsmB/NOP family class I SAM-dependent RNA methyltransferase [Tenacibaculum sp. MAR_2009_124]SEB38511.1 16S rRNA (cytosine967-C5)-methyltransferase [Tenacibaculum sp. MAR_2009_124]
MRLHRNLVYAVIDSLRDIFNEDVYADKAVELALKRDKRWGARDRKFVAETIYDIVRWKRLYGEIANVKVPYSRPDLWRLFVVWCVLRGIKLPDWNQIEPTPTRRIKGKFDELSKIRKFRESIPDWMDEIGVSELGEEVWTKEIAALNKQAEVILRTNTLNISKEKLLKVLATEDVNATFIKGHDDALKLVERANVFKTQAFKQGYFEVQDASSQLVAKYLEVEPGMKVIDTCAGAGGKTLHLASLMQNKGQIIAMDIYESKLKKLKVRARRNGVHNIDLKVIDSNKVIKKLHDKADRVLIDAPCSGIGVIRRNPDSKWKLEPEFLDKIRATQQEILARYSKMVKSGGKLVYATCSVLPSENQQQIEFFLASDEGKDFAFVSDKKVLAHKSGYDGFYMALLERK